MGDRIIRSRKPIRPGQSGSYSPSHGSPIRRNDNGLYPQLSGSEDDDDVDQELVELETYPDTTLSLNSTLNSSSDVADCAGVTISRSRTEKNIKFYDSGNIQEMNLRKTREKISFPKKVTENQEKSNLVPACIVGIGILVVVAVTVYYFYQANRSPFDDNNGRNRPRLHCSFEQAIRDFPQQDKMLWKSLQISVEMVLNDIPTKPSIFLLAYEDVTSANKITRSIVERATECMDSRGNALVLSPEDLAQKEMQADYGVVITKYRNQLEKSGVMLVHDLNKVPSKVAPAFHVFCDAENPLVDRSIIFLTMQLADSTHSDSYGNRLQLVENYLRSNWSDVKSFILDPLITRVTDQVYLLRRE